jgi:hypothetical protein
MALGAVKLERTAVNRRRTNGVYFTVDDPALFTIRIGGVDLRQSV